ncbi:sensor domain-containing diguanylate cyclase [Noviherbaspirillum pedocola]|uniref:diguanylate cyclase n=1 Tax=Noviherbaspirillum pedocola TaxID=2801341 RepID=A0A934SY68_9BURK|nr:sensor domain-containing diguanylate cyclase [Noviherbaspirillum pedocola]MBK4737917.1 GGDEF domain-containing protein [Noviherbaspirillum pedocola]
MAFAFVALVILSFVGAEGWSVWQARQDCLDSARVTTINMTRALTQHANDTIQAADIALVGVVEALENDGMDEAAKPNIKTLLQRTVVRFPALNTVSIYDSQGRGLATSRTVITGKFAIPRREYFRYHASHGDATAHVSEPVRSVTSGQWVLPVSRRINHPDGSFAGVAVATIEIDYFAQYQNTFDIGSNGAILLMMDNGTVIVRRPYDPALIGADLSKGRLYRAYLRTGEQGSTVLTAVLDGKERLYNYQRLADYPVIVSSALAVDDVLAHWREDKQRTTAIEAVVLAVLCVVGYRLIRLIDERERAQEELRQAKAALEVTNKTLERLSLQDALTGLGNRRLFDTALAEEFARAVRGGTSLALLLIDVDCFKRYNDEYGHPAGDACLRQIGDALLRTGSRPGDVAVRYGGEELAVLLPDTDEAGAIAMGERFRIAIHALEMLHVGSPIGMVTVSVGAAACGPGLDSSSAQSLVDAADTALYTAKEGGRNQVRAAAPRITNC